MDPAATPREDPPTQQLAALLIARGGYVAVVLGGAERWRQLQAYTLAPIELPGGPVAAGTSPPTAAEETASRLLGGQAPPEAGIREVSAGAGVWETPAGFVRRRLDGMPPQGQVTGGRAHALPSKHTYGRTSAHAIDRLDSFPPTEVRPLIYLERGLPAEQAITHPPRRVEVYVYRGALAGDPIPSPVISGVLWLPLPALRQAVRGLPLADLCAMRDVVWQPAPRADIPGDLFVYVPAEYGERHLLRVAAKYGRAAVFQDEDSSDEA